MVKLPSGVAEKYEAAMELPEGVTNFGVNGDIDFTTITEGQAARLVASGSPYLTEKSAKTATVAQPALPQKTA